MLLCNCDSIACLIPRGRAWLRARQGHSSTSLLRRRSVPLRPRAEAAFRIPAPDLPWRALYPITQFPICLLFIKIPACLFPMKTIMSERASPPVRRNLAPSCFSFWPWRPPPWLRKHLRRRRPQRRISHRSGSTTSTSVPRPTTSRRRFATRSVASLLLNSRLISRLTWTLLPRRGAYCKLGASAP